MKIAAGWINGYNPLHALILNSDGYAVPSPSVISAVQASFFQPPSVVHISLTPTPCHVSMVQLPPPTNTTPIVPPEVNSTNAGMEFRKLVSRRNTTASADYASTLSNAYVIIYVVNGCHINGYVYDANGNCIS